MRTPVPILVALAILALALALAGCGDDGPTAPAGGANVQLDRAAAASATATPEDGGTVTAVAAGGARHTLTLPPGALTDTTEITLTPVSAIAGITFSGGLVAAAHFEPEGLRLGETATLAIDLPPGTDADSLIGFAYRGDGEDLHLYPLTVEGSTATLHISHFSGGGVGNGTPALPGVVPACPVSRLESSPVFQDTPPNGGDLGVVLSFWYDVHFQPQLEDLGTSSTFTTGDVDCAIDGFRTWNRLLHDTYPDSIENRAFADVGITRDVEAATLMLGAYQNVIEVESGRCDTENSLARAANTLRFQEEAVRDFGANAPDLDSVLRDLPVQVVIADLAFPANLAGGELGRLTGRVGYRIGTRAPVFGAQSFDVFVVMTNATALGRPSASVTPSAAGAFELDVTRTSSIVGLTLSIRAEFTTSPLQKIQGEDVVTRGPSTLSTLVGTYEGPAMWFELPPHPNQRQVQMRIVIFEKPNGKLGADPFEQRGIDPRFHRLTTGLEGEAAGNVLVATDPLHPGEEILTATLSENRLAGAFARDVTDRWEFDLPRIR